MATAPCPPREQLGDFLLGRLSAETLDSISDHLETCASCETQVVRMEGGRDSLLDALALPDGDVECLSEPELESVLGRVRAWSSAGDQPATAMLDEGSRLGPYQILNKLGNGGMGSVYAAMHVPLERRVALKVLSTERMSNPRAIARFRREMRAMGRLEHPNLVGARDAGEVDGMPYLAMDLVEGLDLGQLSKRVGSLPIADACELIRQAAAGLEHARGQGIVHRDVKPANIMLTPEGRVKVLDLGLARLVDASSTEEFTRLGVVMGTLEFMAPEQLADSRQVDAAADVYSLGATLYKLLTGRPPHPRSQGGTTPQQMFAIVQAPPPSIHECRRGISQDLACLLERMLEKEPGQRLATAGAVAEALEPFAAGHDLPRLFVQATQSTHANAGQPLAPENEMPAPTDEAAAGPAADLGQAPTATLRSFHARRAALTTAAGLLVMVGLTWLVVFMYGSLVTNDREADPPAAQATAIGGNTEDDNTEDDNMEDDNMEDDNNAESDATVPAAAVNRDAFYPLAILQFEDRGTNDAEFGPRISDVLFANLAVHPNLSLVDREELERSLDEQELNLSGMVNPQEAIQVGRLTGAKILVTGSVTQLDEAMFLTAKLLGTETGRVVGVSVRGSVRDDFADLAEQLAEKVARRINTGVDDLLPEPQQEPDRLAGLKIQLRGAELPSVWIQITERHVGAPAIDPAAETELIRFCRETGFTVIDSEGSRKQADIELVGEGFSEQAARHGNLVSVKARVEIKAVDRKTGEVRAVDRQTAIAVDLAEQIAGKTALEDAAAQIAERLLPKLVDDKQ